MAFPGGLGEVDEKPMNSIRLCNVYLCGLGALGAMYAAQLAALCGNGGPGIRVRAIADAARIARARELSVNGRPFSPSWLSPDEAAPPADLLIVAVKWHQLEAAIATMRPFVGPATTIISLLNGIASEEVLGQAFGAEHLLTALVIETDAMKHGREIRFSKVGTIVFGERCNDPPSPRVEAVRALFGRAAIPCRVPHDMQRELWWKFMLNVGINQISAVLHTTYGSFSRLPQARELMRLACREVVRLAECEGIALAEEDIEGFFPIFARLSPDGKPSMLQDVEAHRKTEVEMFAGTVVELGRRHGVPTPVNATLLAMIQVIEQGWTATEG